MSDTSSITYRDRRRHDYSPTRSSPRRHHQRHHHADEKSGYHAGAVVRRDGAYQQVRRIPRAPSPPLSWGEPGYEEYDLRRDGDRYRGRQRVRDDRRRKKRNETGIMLAVGLAVLSFLLCYGGFFDRDEDED